MEDADESISSSPTPVSRHSSSRIRHWQRSDMSFDSSKPSTVAADMATFDLLCEADRLDCQRALEEPVRSHVVPASDNFMSLQWLLESQQLPLDEISTCPKSPSSSVDQNYCLQSKEEIALPAEEILKPSSHNKNVIVEQILQDFCTSPSYLDDAQPTYYTHPDFRFYNKTIRTYSRQCRRQKKTTLEDDDDEHLSCSSGLSVQEDFVTQMPITKHCDFDANSSQLICENLLNLSAFFTQNQVNSCSSIDLPADRAQTEIIVLEEPQEAEDILMDNGYYVGNTEECSLLDEDDDFRTAGKKIK
ncbi:hypothetical protein KR093_002661 [Drosophila rubida]|uniref:Uncharacterized protein n=1 Tax=Drosophila rubida TaxID=30044 RepID=A0AAD4JYE9_9MUSC|nr:hypothetical protein KR093_002661 [Drosophila rubida]